MAHSGGIDAEKRGDKLGGVTQGKEAAEERGEGVEHVTAKGGMGEGREHLASKVASVGGAVGDPENRASGGVSVPAERV